MGLLKLIKQNENLRKIFGERELKIVEKQLLGINLTQSERNRLSRDIRKKFEAISELARFSDEFKLKKGAEVNRLIEEAKEEILNTKHLKNIKRIAVFGSTAERQRTFRSDVDIAVEFKEIDSREAVKFRLEVLRNVSDLIDIQVYNVLPDKIKKEIDEKGKVIYGRED